MARNLLHAILLILLLAATVAALVLAEHRGILENSRQVQSLSVFCGVIWAILLFEDYRLIVCLSAVAAVLGFGFFSTFEQFISAAGLDVILFLLGTFLVAGYLEESLFFEHVANQIVRRVGRRLMPLMTALMLSAMCTSAIVGEVAAILFVGGAMLHIANRLQLKPIPFLIMLVFATNIGSAASAFGPVGVTIAIKTHLTVLDFFRWATPIALATLVLVLAISRWWFSEEWVALDRAVRALEVNSSVPDPTRKSHAPAWMLTIAMTALMVFHQQIENRLGLAPDRMLLAASLGAGAVGLILSGSSARKILHHRVDWGTLFFFLTLFIVVGALEATGVTGAVAQQMMRHTGRQPAALVLAVGWTTGILSAFVANLLAVAAFLPIVAQLQSHGAACPNAVYWLMLFGATFMGNMTSIGSTCNIIACGMADKRGHGTIYFRSWLRIGLIVSLSSMVLASFLLAIQTHWLSK